MIKYIREKLDDWESLIIIIYKDKKDKNNLIKESLFIVDYINKNKSITPKLTRAIQICLKNFDKRPNSLRYSYKNIVYNIEFKKILYIEKEQDNKRCIIKTTNNEYYIPGTIKQIYNLLDKRFIKGSRSCIINIEQVSTYDIKTNIITFKNKLELNAISRDNKKDIVNYLRMM
jgi:DNA-binding LytR/AlgR family response regulator